MFIARECWSTVRVEFVDSGGVVTAAECACPWYAAWLCSRFALARSRGWICVS